MAGNNRYGARRTWQTRKVLPIIKVICDDTRTAVNYFTLLKHEVKERKTVHVFSAPHSGASANAVIRYAKLAIVGDSEPGDEIFVLIDLDTNPDPSGIRETCAAAGIKVALSQPCFEVWTLAHFEDTGEAFGNCSAVVRRVEAAWKLVFGEDFGPKAQADYAKLMSRRTTAIQCCRKRQASKDQSWTEVWRVVEYILA